MGIIFSSCAPDRPDESNDFPTILEEKPISSPTTPYKPPPIEKDSPAPKVNINHVISQSNIGKQPQLKLQRDEDPDEDFDEEPVQSTPKKKNSLVVEKKVVNMNFDDDDDVEDDIKDKKVEEKKDIRKEKTKETEIEDEMDEDEVNSTPTTPSVSTPPTVDLSNVPLSKPAKAPMKLGSKKPQPKPLPLKSETKPVHLSVVAEDLNTKFTMENNSLEITKTSGGWGDDDDLVIEGDFEEEEEENKDTTIEPPIKKPSIVWNDDDEGWE